MPGVPLAVAGVNAVTGLAGGALSMGGPGSLAVAGAVVGMAALGTVAARAGSRSRQRRNAVSAGRPPTAFRRRGNASPAAGSAMFGGVPSTRRGAQHRQGPASSGYGQTAAQGGRHRGNNQQLQPAGSPASTTGGRGRTVGGGRAGVQDRSGPATGRTAPGAAAGAGGRSGGMFRRSTDTSGQRSGAGGPTTGQRRRGGGLAGVGRRGGVAPVGTRAAGSSGPAGSRGQVRAAKAAERTNRRLAKGIARAERRAGITPTTQTPGASDAVNSTGERQLTSDQRKRLKRSALRYGVRMAGSGAAAGLVGALSGAAFNWRHRGRVAGHTRRAWRFLADRARSAREKRDAAILGQGVDGQVPVPAEHVNHPGHQTTSGPKTPATAGAPAGAAGPVTLGKPTNQEVTVSDASQSTVPAFSLSSAADVMLQAATTFDPEFMSEFQVLVDDLPVAFATIQDVLRVLAEKSAEQLPVDPAVVEEIGEGYRAMGKVVQSLEEVGEVYRRVHEVDIERVENPRNGVEAERKWNV